MENKEKIKLIPCSVEMLSRPNYFEGLCLHNAAHKGEMSFALLTTNR
jgi:hypothetical protein